MSFLKFIVEQVAAPLAKEAAVHAFRKLSRETPRVAAGRYDGAQLRLSVFLRRPSIFGVLACLQHLWNSRQSTIPQHTGSTLA